MPDDFDRPQTKPGDKTFPGDGGDRPFPKVKQAAKASDGYVNPSTADVGQRGVSAPGGARSNDGYDNLGINTDGPVGMGNPGYGKDRKNYNDKKGGNYK